MESSSLFALKVNEPQIEQCEDMQNLRKSIKIEEDIRKSKLRDVKRMKEELEQKLLTLNENVTYLAGTPRAKKEKETAMTKEDKQKLKVDLEQKQKEAEDFILKLKQEKKERKKKEKEREKEVREKQKKDADELNKKLKEREDEMLKKRKDDTLKVYQQLKQKREEEHKKTEEHLTKTSLPPRDEYLYKKLEDKYNKEVLMPALEDKKRELAKKRNLFKPVSKEEIDDHIRKHEILMAQKEEERQKEVIARKKQEENVMETIKKFKTPAQERVSLEEGKVKDELEKKKDERKLRREKMENYANLIKDICPVKVSESKAAELKKQVEQLRHPVRQSRDIRKEYELANLNKRSLKEGAGSHSADKLRKEQTETNMSSPRLIDKGSEALPKARHNTSDKSKLALKSAILQQEQQKMEQAKAKKLDYLSELRKKREENYGASKSIKYNWSSDLKNEQLNPSEKYNRLVGKANMIEEQAKMKEKLLLAKGGTEKNPEMGEYVSDMFIDAIKAKLAILENL